MASNLQGHAPFTGNEWQRTSCWEVTTMKRGVEILATSR